MFHVKHLLLCDNKSRSAPRQAMTGGAPIAIGGAVI